MKTTIRPIIDKIDTTEYHKTYEHLAAIQRSYKETIFNTIRSVTAKPSLPAIRKQLNDLIKAIAPNNTLKKELQKIYEIVWLPKDVIVAVECFWIDLNAPHDFHNLRNSLNNIENYEKNYLNYVYFKRFIINTANQDAEQFVILLSDMSANLLVLLFDSECYEVNRIIQSLNNASETARITELLVKAKEFHGKEC